LAYFVKNSFWDLDFKELYYDQTLKDSLLRWLDEDVILKHEINRHKEYLLKNFGGEKKKTFTQNYVSYDLKLNFDSIYSDSTLYQSYYNQAIMVGLYRYQKTSLDKQNELLPPSIALVLHSLIAYPESYKKIKYWWYLKNKKEGTLYSCLLRMNDPEASTIMDETINEAIKSKGKAIHDYGIVSDLKYVANSLAVKNLLKILPIKKEIVVIYGESLDPLDLYTFYALLELLQRNGIEGNFLPFNKLNFPDSTKEIKYLREHKSEIEKAANQLIEKLEADEQHWMVNMPFDYVPDVAKDKE
jgi:hypothetical protein